MAAPMSFSRWRNFFARMPISSRAGLYPNWLRHSPARKVYSESPQLSEQAEHEPSSIQQTATQETDEPIVMDNPYTKPHKQCVICQYDIEPDYKNVQLLSQFVSPFTGRIYGRHITGLCTPMQRHIARLIKQSQKNGFMAYMYKETVYLKDPKLYDPFSRVEHPPDDDVSSK